MGSEGSPFLPISLIWEVAAMKKTGDPYGRLRGDTGQHRRILLVMALLGVAAFAPILWRLRDLMIVHYEEYENLALRNQTRTTAVAADRGDLYDRNMNLLASSVSVENIYLNPRELKQSGADTAAIAEALAPLLERDAAWIQEQAKNTGRRYMQIGWNVDEGTASQIRAYINDNQIAGIHLEPASQRVYPYGSLAAQVIGFTNASGQGSEGVEAAYNSFLEGDAGKVITSKGNNEIDMPYSYEKYLESLGGADVILTLDTTVQACLEKRMEEAIAKFDVRNGAFGMVMNVNTGEILAMATLGSYDPNAYLEIADEDTAQELEQLRASGSERYQEALTAARLKQWRNRCISDGYEPGSTFKVLTMAAALDSGAITLNTGFHCGGAEQIPGRSQLLHCWRSAGHGSQQTPQALQNSCNLAFAHIALKMGGDTFYKYIEKFGILEKTGIDLSGESKGIFFDKEIVTNTDKWGTASLTSGSFGQTFKITPLQLVRAISSVVNGGSLMEPYIVSEIVDADGHTILKQEPTVVRRTISEETSNMMLGLIESVVNEGTAKNAAVAGYAIGGKTGTSEKIDVFDENGQRVLDKIVSFVGVAPMDNPEYIVLVALDTPSRETGIYISGGVMAAPTVGAVMSDILPYLGVSTSYDADDLAGRLFSVEDLAGLTPAEAEKRLAVQNLAARFVGAGEVVTGQIPAAGQSVPGGSEILLYLGAEPESKPITVPDFTGMTRAQAAEAAQGLYLLETGNTDEDAVVTAQDILPGTEAEPGTTICLTFTDTNARD